MASLIEKITQGIIPDIVKACAAEEQMPLDIFISRMLAGSIVIPMSLQSPIKGKRFCAIGKGLKTKVNANIGTSPDQASEALELDKLHAALDAGADAVMDLSTGGDINAIRRSIRKACPVPLGTVPIYQAVCETVRTGKKAEELDAEHLFQVIELHADDGIDFITVHCGINMESLRKLNASGRLTGVVSRGGSFLVRWMEATGQENPLYEYFDRLLDIAARYDLTLSLGDGFRPGSIADATDLAQTAELTVLGELTERARQSSVQVMVEGPGHVPLDHISANIRMQKTICREAPFYVLGPLVTDVAAGYDHITSAIGGAIAAAAGADFLCYVTPSEHVHLPEPDDVRTGVIAARIAAHAGDIVKNVPGAKEWDREMSKARKDLDWEKQKLLALDRERFTRLRSEHKPGQEDVCTMCGEFCAMRDASGVWQKEEAKG